MTKEEHFLMQVIADFLNKRKTKPQNGLDWEAVFTLAEKHQVSGIIYYQCREFMTEDARSVFEKRYFSTICCYASRQSDLDQLELLLRESNIPYFVVKGLAVSKYYPVPELRTMGDTDIVVHAEDRPEVRRIMIGLGYDVDSVSKNEWHFLHRNMAYEVHDHLLYDEGTNYEQYQAFFNDCWGYVHDDQLDPSFHFLFLLIHLRKHLMGWGVGFRQFMDAAVMAGNEKDLNWDWIQEKLEELHLTSFASTCSALISRWFDLSLPLAGKPLDDAFYQEATEAVLSSGIFGFGNLGNAANPSVNTIRDKPVSRMAIYANGIRRIFPSYKQMAQWAQFNYLDGRPYLLPAAYVHRIIDVLSHFSEKKYNLHGYFPSKSEVEKRKEYLDQWGL